MNMAGPEYLEYTYGLGEPSNLCQAGRQSKEPIEPNWGWAKSPVNVLSGMKLKARDQPSSGAIRRMRARRRSRSSGGVEGLQATRNHKGSCLSSASFRRT